MSDSQALAEDYINHLEEGVLLGAQFVSGGEPIVGTIRIWQDREQFERTADPRDKYNIIKSEVDVSTWDTLRRLIER